MIDKEKLAVGLDAGSFRTRCVILLKEDARLRYLGHGEVPSMGWNKSRLADQAALTGCVQAAVPQAEEEARVQVDAMVVGIGCRTLDGDNTRGRGAFGRTHVVRLGDLADAIE